MNESSAEPFGGTYVEQKSSTIAENSVRYNDETLDKMRNVNIRTAFLWVRTFYLPQCFDSHPSRFQKSERRCVVLFSSLISTISALEARRRLVSSATAVFVLLYRDIGHFRCRCCAHSSSAAAAAVLIRKNPRARSLRIRQVVEFRCEERIHFFFRLLGKISFRSVEAVDFCGWKREESGPKRKEPPRSPQIRESQRYPIFGRFSEHIQTHLVFRWSGAEKSVVVAPRPPSRRDSIDSSPLIDKPEVPKAQPSPTPFGQKAFLIKPAAANRRQNPMAAIHFRHRYLVRHYVYPILCILLLFLLIRWNSESRKRGRAFNDLETLEMSVLDAPPPPPVVVPIVPGVPLNVPRPAANAILAKTRPPPQAPPAPPAAVPNTVRVTVYMEAQCPDTTGFIHRNLLPTWKRLGHLNRLNITIIPFGKASCQPNGDDYSCECQHGAEECELNTLMNCVIEQRPNQADFIPLIGCIQGRDDLDSAIQMCLGTDPQREALSQCARSVAGRRLLVAAGEKTTALGDQFNFVPWVMIGDTRDVDAFYALDENVCKAFVPQPVECQSAEANGIQRVARQILRRN